MADLPIPEGFVAGPVGRKAAKAPRLKIPKGFEAAPDATPTATPAAAAPGTRKMGILGEEGPSRKEMGTLPWLGERALELAGNIGGGALGGLVAAPAALAEAGTIAGIPLAAATEWAAIRGGEAAGQTAADVGNALINQYAYGTKANITPGSVLKDFAYNVPGAVVGGAVSHFLPGIAGRLVSKPELTEVAEAAAGKASRGVSEAQEALG